MRGYLALIIILQNPGWQSPGGLALLSLTRFNTHSCWSDGSSSVPLPGLLSPSKHPDGSPSPTGPRLSSAKLLSHYLAPHHIVPRMVTFSYTLKSQYIEGRAKPSNRTKHLRSIYYFKSTVLDMVFTHKKCTFQQGHIFLMSQVAWKVETEERHTINVGWINEWANSWNSPLFLSANSNA